jgi:hypothetical protein
MVISKNSNEFNNRIIQEKKKKKNKKENRKNISNLIALIIIVFHFIYGLLIIINILFSTNLHYLFMLSLILGFNVLAVIIFGDCPISILERKYIVETLNNKKEKDIPLFLISIYNYYKKIITNNELMNYNCKCNSSLYTRLIDVLILSCFCVLIKMLTIISINTLTPIKSVGYCKLYIE